MNFILGAIDFFFMKTNSLIIFGISYAGSVHAITFYLVLRLIIGLRNIIKICLTYKLSKICTKTFISKMPFPEHRT